MFEDELLLVMSPKHRLAAASQVRPKDLQTETILIYPPREESTLINKLLKPAGVEAQRVIEVPLTEASPLRPTTPYGASKVAAEFLGLQAFLGRHGGEWALLMAAATVITVPMLILFFFAQRTFIQGITLTGMKG